MLDVDHGTYPFVTSSNTLAGQAAAGTGVGSNAIGYVLGITKAYTTRVGAGPLPSELDMESAKEIRNIANEFGKQLKSKFNVGIVPGFVLVNTEGKEILKRTGKVPSLEKIVELVDSK